MPTDVEICNLALSAIGARGRLTSLADPTREAEECSLWWPQVMDNVLQAAWWPEVKRARRLTLAFSEETDGTFSNTDPLPNWKYAYALPVDYLRAWHLSDYSRFEIARVHDGTTLRLSIQTNSHEPVLIYSTKDFPVAGWGPHLVNVAVYTLASVLAMPLTGDISKQQMNIQLATRAIHQAQAESATVDHSEKTFPETLAARGALVPDFERFYYPKASLLLGNISG